MVSCCSVTSVDFFDLYGNCGNPKMKQISLYNTRGTLFIFIMKNAYPDCDDLLLIVIMIAIIG